MSDINLPIIAVGVPAELCYTTLSADIPIIAQYLRAIFSGNEWNTGSSTPAAADRTKPWFRTNSDGTDDGVWTFYGGFWIKRHMLFPGAVIMYEGAAADIDTLDSGEAGVVTNVTGPFFQEVTEMRARSPMGPGTLPSTTVVAVGDDLGEEKHVQVIGEMIEHDHDIPYSGQGAASGGDGAHILNGTPVHTGDHFTATAGSDPPDGMNVIHPVRGIYFLRRTARLFYRRVA